MRVLLLGATGNVGSRLVPSLVANDHEVVLYVRSPAKLATKAKALATAVVAGDAKDSESIKKAILDNACDAIINAAGLANILNTKGDLPAIFKAVAEAAIAAGEQRGKPLRAWFLSGFSLLDSPKAGHILLDYVPLFPAHKINFEYIKSVPTQKLAWSLFCANYMPPERKEINYSPEAGADAGRLVASTNAPPAWGKSLQWVPLLGYWLNIFTQAGGYTTPLETCTDFMATDLSKGPASPYVGQRVGVKLRPKSA